MKEFNLKNESIQLNPENHWMFPQGSLFGINKCACVPGSCFYSPGVPSQRDIVQRDQVSFRRKVGSAKCAKWGASQLCDEISLSLCVLLCLSPMLSLLPAHSLAPMSLSLGSASFLCLHSLCASSFLLFSISNSPFLPSKMLLKWPDSEAESRMVTVARAWGRRKG